jgi:hypothetical protein
VVTPGQPRSQELVFVPARPRVSGGSSELTYEVRTLADGTMALPVFSTLTRLVAALGRYQPWACVPLQAVQADTARSGMPQMVLDPVVDESAWRWREDGLRTFAARQADPDLPR